MSRKKRQQRTRYRLDVAVAGRPYLDLDRKRPMEAILRTRSETEARRGLDFLYQKVLGEVGVLERWVQSLNPAERSNGAAVRRALELLRGFGHLAILDYGQLPDDFRPILVQWLALEHRWCYAAAGTDRRTFKRVTGRTGAR